MQDQFKTPGNNRYLADRFFDTSCQQNLVEILQFVAQTQPDITAFCFLDKNGRDKKYISYLQLNDKAQQIAKNLAAITQIGDRAILIYPSGIEFIAAFLGCLYAGVIAIPVYPPTNQVSKDKLKNIIANAKPSIILSSSDFPAINFANLERVNTDTLPLITVPLQSVELDLSNLAFLQYTSGSTGTPKGVMVSHGNLINNLRQIAHAFDPGPEHLRQDNINVSWLPPYHDMGLIGSLLAPLCCGLSSVIMSPFSFLMNPVNWLQAITDFAANISGGPTFAYDYCVKKITAEQKAKLDLSSWEVAYCGAEPLFIEVFERFYQAFKSCGFNRKAFLPSYGLAEATLCVSIAKRNHDLTVNSFSIEELQANRIEQVATSNSGSARNLMSSGIPVQTVKIVDPESLEPKKADTIGEVWVASPSVAQGYWDNPDQTRETFQVHLINGDNETNYLRTGDLGFIHENELYITGRIKDLIIIHGYNHYPQDIEQSIEKSHPLIRGCAAISIPVENEEKLAIICEVDRNTSQSDFDEIQHVISQAVAQEHQLMVYTIAFIPALKLPRTTSGKIQRYKCRTDLLNNSLPMLHQWIGKTFYGPVETIETKPNLIPENIQTWLVNKIAERTKTKAEEIGLEVPFTEFGIDSIAAVEIASELSQWLSVELSPLLLWEQPSIRSLANYLSTTDLQQIKQTAVFDLNSFYMNETFLNKLALIPQINKIITKQKHRELVIDNAPILDFSSCCYLGFDYHPEILAAIPQAVETWGTHASRTRAVASPQPFATIEKALAELMHVHDTVLFPNVAMINFGVLPLLAGKDGVIIADNEAHVTIHEGCELAKARGTVYEKFPHNNLAALEKILQRHAGKRIIIAADGVYSMAVTYFDVPRYVELAKKYNAILYIDDAHGFGIIGENPSKEHPYGFRGNGIVNYFGLAKEENARIVYVASLSKAFSSYAAFITCENEEMKALLQRSSTYVFSGPVPIPTLAAAQSAILVNEKYGDLIRQKVYKLTKKLLDGIKELGLEVFNTNYFPVVFVIIGNIDKTIQATQIAWEHGLLITPGIFPAVPIHQGGLRFSVTALNTEAQINQVLVGLKAIKDKLF